MSKYNKLIGSLVGGVVGLGVTFGFLPEEIATSENIEQMVIVIGGIVALGSSIGTYFSAKNAD